MAISSARYSELVSVESLEGLTAGRIKIRITAIINAMINMLKKISKKGDLIRDLALSLVIILY